ncbi:MAG: ATP-dependent zinc metalloprotease FtsH [Pirellulaceae bacterium]
MTHPFNRSQPEHPGQHSSSASPAAQSPTLWAQERTEGENAREQNQARNLANSDREAVPGSGLPGYPWQWVVWLVVLGGLAVVLYSNRDSDRKEVSTWATFKQIAREEGLVEESVVVRNDRIDATLRSDFTFEDVKPEPGEELPIQVQIDEQNRAFYLEQLADLDLAWRDETGRAMGTTLLLMWGPFLLLLVLIGWGVSRARKAAESGPAGMFGQFGSSKHRVATKEIVNVKLDDVAGIDEAKAEVGELIEFLKRPARFQTLGARVPRGVLLQGPPGCGKTRLAQAIAGEADVPFFSITGSDFMEMFVGVGASRARDLFNKAKRNAPCIVFLDEIDSIGRKRGGQSNVGGGHGEREQTLDAILSEMDGFEPNDQVIVIAATNRPDVLDPALTRRGRFDRPVTVPLPDVRGRTGILQIHAERVRLSNDVDLGELARSTPMFSGADLAAVVNEAAIIAGLEKSKEVRMEHLRQARDKVRFGRAMNSRKIEQEQRLKSAYHEAGHALVQAMLEDADPLEKATIIPRGQALGGTFALPGKDRYSLGRRYLEGALRIACAGRVAEAEKTGDMSSGAADDIKRVTAMARKMVLEWGMSEQLGFINYDDEEERMLHPALHQQSEQTARQVDEEVRRIVGNAYNEAERIVKEHWPAAVAIAEALLERESLMADEIHRLIEENTDETPAKPAATSPSR